MPHILSRTSHIPTLPGLGTIPLDCTVTPILPLQPLEMPRLSVTTTPPDS